MITITLYSRAKKPIFKYVYDGVEYEFHLITAEPKNFIWAELPELVNKYTYATKIVLFAGRVFTPSVIGLFADDLEGKSSFVKTLPYNPLPDNYWSSQ